MQHLVRLHLQYSCAENLRLSATYYMDGTCEVELPNRNRVFVTRGKYCSRFQKSTKRLPLVFSLIPRSHEEYGCANKVIGGLDVTSLNDNKVL